MKIRLRKLFSQGVLAISLIVFWQARAAAVRYEVSAAVIQGGAASGYYVLTLYNRDTARTYPAQVRVTAYEKNTQRTFQFPVQNVEVPAGTRNPITTALSRAGARMVSFKLRDAGFNRFARVHTQIVTEGTAPLFGLVLLITDDHGNVLWTGDIRQCQVMP